MKPFSPKQQGMYRKLVEQAWAVVCAREGIDPTLRCKSGKRCGECVHCTWYMAELKEGTGATSTTQLDNKRGFEAAMKHFAEIAGNLYWMTRIHGADARRLLHNVHEVCRERDFDEHYIEGVARKALKLAVLPALGELSYEQLAEVLSALKCKAIHLRDCRQPSVELLGEGDPF
jgi:hypothetical protein